MQVGDVIGEWTVVSGPFINYRGKKEYLIQCRCGSEVKREPYAIKKIQSCRRCAAVRIGLVNRVDPWWATVTQVMNKYIKTARKENRVFELTREKFEEIISSDCEYCGGPPANRQGSKNGRVIGSNGGFLGMEPYQGIDRVDNSKGYTIENVVPCCKICNRAKNDLGIEEWMSYLDRIATKRR